MIRYLVIAFAALVACKKETLSDAPIQDPVDTSSAVVRYMGEFMNGPYGSVSGEAKIVADSAGYYLALVDVRISSGPDLHVYLSQAAQPNVFIDLGLLRSTMGTQVYRINGLPDFSKYRFALIHCQQFNHLFGFAELKE